jgi:hypothetical protein
MPGLTVSGQNVTHRVFMLRQAMWVLIKIIEADDNTFTNGIAAAAGGALANDVIVANAAAVPLALGAIPAAAANSAIKADNPMLTAQDIALLGIILNVANQDFVANPVARGAAIRSEIEVRSKDVVSNFGGADPASYGVLLDALSDALGGPRKVAQLKYLIAFTAAQAAVVAPGAGILAHNLAVPANVARLNTFNQPVYNGLTFHLMGSFDNLFPGAAANTTAPRYGWVLFANSIQTDVANNVIHLVAPAPNSLFSAAAMNFRKGSGQSYQFVQDPTGLFNLNQIDAAGNVIATYDFTADFNKLTRTDGCKAFGGSGSFNVCQNMIVDCLGQATHDTARCVAHFKSLPDISTNLRGWAGLGAEQKRYMSYRVLLGFNLPPVLNVNGDYSYVDANGVNVYTDDNIKAQLDLNTPVGRYNPEPIAPGGAAAAAAGAQIVLPGAVGAAGAGRPGNEAQVVADKVAYIRKLMTSVGTIVTKTRPGSFRPRMDDIKPPTVSIFAGSFVPSLAFPAVALRAMHMHGGAKASIDASIEELENSTIMYGGSIDDINKIVKSIEQKKQVLADLGAKLSDKQLQYIKEKMNSFTQLGVKIEEIDNLLVNIISLTSQYPNRDIAFTEADIARYQERQQKDKQKLVEKMAKMHKLDTKLLYARN